MWVQEKVLAEAMPLTKVDAFFETRWRLAACVCGGDMYFQIEDGVPEYKCLSCGRTQRATASDHGTRRMEGGREPE